MKKFVFSLAILLSSQSLLSGAVQARDIEEEYVFVCSKEKFSPEAVRGAYKYGIDEAKAIVQNNMIPNIYSRSTLETISIVGNDEFHDVSVSPEKVGDYRNQTSSEKLLMPAALAVVSGVTYGGAHLLLQPYAFDSIRGVAYKMMQSSGHASSFLGAVGNRLQDQAANAASLKVALEYSGAATTVGINLGLAASKKGLAASKKAWNWLTGKSAAKAA